MVTRITNNMITNTLMSNLYLNLGSVDTLQNQLSSSRKYAHISDDPSALIYGQAARNKLARLSHYQNTVGTSLNWLTQAEDGIMELQKTTASIYEELINAGGAKTIMDRQIIQKAVGQLRDHYLDTLNSSFGDRFVFGGYNTPGDWVDGKPVDVKPFSFDVDGSLLFNGFNVSQFDGMPAEFLLVNSAGITNVTDLEIALDDIFGNPGDAAAALAAFNAGKTPAGTTTMDDMLKFHILKNDVISFDVGPGISMPVTINGLDVLFYTTYDTQGNAIARNMYEMISEVHDKIGEEQIVTKTDPITGIVTTTKEPVYTVDYLSNELIKPIKEGQQHLLVKTAEIGGRNRRLELLEARYEGDEINYETMRSDAEDADIAEVIMNLRIAETIYQAALSAGARVIQPTLMDFLR